MKLKCFPIVLLPLLFAFPANANTCSSQEASVKVTPTYYGYSVHRTVDRSGLERLRNAPVEKGMEIMGLTVGGLSYQMKLSVGITGTRGSGYCGSAKSLEVLYGTDEPVKVFIAPNVKVGSCEDRTTMEHELRHVGFIEQAIREGGVLIESSLKRELRGKTFTGRDEEAVSSSVKEFATGIIQREFSKVSSKLDAQNASIDTRESYSATAARCSNR